MIWYKHNSTIKLLHKVCRVTWFERSSANRYSKGSQEVSSKERHNTERMVARQKETDQIAHNFRPFMLSYKLKHPSPDETLWNLTPTSAISLLGVLNLNFNAQTREHNKFDQSFVALYDEKPPHLARQSPEHRYPSFLRKHGVPSDCSAPHKDRKRKPIPTRAGDEAVAISLSPKIPRFVRDH